MIVLESAVEFRAHCETLRQEGPLGLVPTMGFLHAGHVSLIDQARAQSRHVAVTIFVNPAQFGPREDLSRYPRDLQGDLAKCQAAGVAVAFAPKSNETLYPPGFQTYIEPGPLAAPLEGERRPGHFRGVCTVVAKLFTLSRADAAFFGEKDFQQLRVVQQMTTDLDLGTQIVPCPIVRESDGLAMSSRNAYLSADERKRAVSLSRGIGIAQALYATSERRPSFLIGAAMEPMRMADLRIDYVALADPNTLLPPETPQGNSRLLLAAFCGATRLIDNAPLEP